jgi:hypothetical protein
MRLILSENLRAKLGEEAARELVTLINDTFESVKNQILDTPTDRFDRRLFEVKGDLEKGIANTKAELIKWMLILWVSQIAVIMGVIAHLK